MSKKVYIAGKITGLPWEPTVAKFAQAENKLKAQGYTVVNPITLVNDPNIGWADAMRICIASLIDCDMIFMLADSVDSRGAKIELQTAIDHNLEIDWEE